MAEHGDVRGAGKTQWMARVATSTVVRWSWFLILGCSTTLLASAGAAEQSLPSFTRIAEAGPDYGVQGEYVGTIGANGEAINIAAQVIALGDGRFEGVLFAGGLPGAGWDGAMVHHFRGEPSNGVTGVVGIYGERLAFVNRNFTGTIRDGEFTGRADMFRNRVESAAYRMKRIVRRSPTEGAAPPLGAQVLFDGTNVDAWEDGRIVEDGLLDVGTQTRETYGSHRLHLEFQTPFMPTAVGMKRGNSGVYLLGLWEVQVLDSFGWNHENRKFERLSDYGRCGGVHEVAEPRINMCFPPLSWQTYDIRYEAARFDTRGQRVRPAMLSVTHNGVLVHDRLVLPPMQPDDERGESLEGRLGPIQLQQHGNPVRYRNIWIVRETD